MSALHFDGLVGRYRDEKGRFVHVSARPAPAVDEWISGIKPTRRSLWSRLVARFVFFTSRRVDE